MLLFRWVRDQIRQAVVGGFQDGLQDVNDMAAGNAPERIEEFLGRFRGILALPTAEPMEKKPRK